MPLIEELPITNATRATHGWAYVPDVGPLKSTLPPTARKRGTARDSAAKRNGGDTTAKQQKLAQSRLANLEKENYKDTTIPVPQRVRPKDRKMTPNVRRVLGYHRTFAHFLQDEEATTAQAGGSTIGPTPSSSSAAATPLTALHRTSSSRVAAATAAAAAGMPSRPLSRHSSMQPPPRPQTPRSAPFPSPLKAESNSTCTPSAASNTTPDPLLLTSAIPKPVPPRVLAALLAEPPLSYSAARARSLDNPPPPRHLCAICGYWGKLKCVRCGERTCGLLECWRGHEAGGCVP